MKTYRIDSPEELMRLVPGIRDTQDRANARHFAKTWAATSIRDGISATLELGREALLWAEVKGMRACIGCVQRGTVRRWREAQEA